MDQAQCKQHHIWRSVVSICLLATLCMPRANAAAIATNQFLQFSFTDVGVTSTGCQPDDSDGGFCVQSTGTPTAFLSAPPWSFDIVDGTGVLRVTDSLESGDRFEVFDFGASLGLTSTPSQGGDCGDDPAVCLADGLMSHASFVLAQGSHLITIVPVDSPSGGGSGYLIVESAATPVPLPGTLGLVGLVLWAGNFVMRRRSA